MALTIAIITAVYCLTLCAFADRIAGKLRANQRLSAWLSRLAGIFLSTQTYYGTIRVFQSNHPSSLLTLPGEAVLVVLGLRYCRFTTHGDAARAATRPPI